MVAPQPAARVRRRRRAPRRGRQRATRCSLLLDGRVTVRARAHRAASRASSPCARPASSSARWRCSTTCRAPRASPPRSAVRALCIPRAAFLDAIAAHAPAALELVRTLSLRLRESDAAQLEALRAKAERCSRPRTAGSPRENRRLRVELDQRFGFDEFVGSSAAADGGAHRGAARGGERAAGARRRRNRHGQGARGARDPRRERAAASGPSSR